MRIVSWNLGHKTEPRTVPLLGQVVAALRPDVLLLNEYAHDDELHAPMLDELRELGLAHHVISERLSREPRPGFHNQIIAASRLSLRTGDLRGPATITRAALSNFLHVTIEGVPIEVVGVPVPSYKGDQRKRYWKDFAALASRAAGRPILFIGDFNADPNGKSVGGRTLASLELVGWQIPRPPRRQWSHKRGKTKTRIDHALAWQVLPRPSAEYVTDVNGIALAGRPGAVSDHAALVVDVPMLMPADR